MIKDQHLAARPVVAIFLGKVAEIVVRHDDVVAELFVLGQLVDGDGHAVGLHD